MTGHYDGRSLMTETDPEQVAEQTEPLTSIRQADWRHQAKAMSLGYSSILEYAVDELVSEVRELKQRMDRLEETIQTLRNRA